MTYRENKIQVGGRYYATNHVLDSRTNTFTDTGPNGSSTDRSSRKIPYWKVLMYGIGFFVVGVFLFLFVGYKYIPVGSAIYIILVLWSFSIQTTTSSDKTLVYVQNLDRNSTTDRHLTEIFSRFGTVIESRVQKDSSGCSRGFGSVMMGTRDSAECAVAGLHETALHGRNILVYIARKKNESGVLSTSPSSTKTLVYVQNLDRNNTTSRHLTDIFSSFGTVIESRVQKDRSGRSRGFGSVMMGTRDGAECAVAGLHRTFLHGRSINVNIAQKKTLPR